jgi:hypothetical protein
MAQMNQALTLMARSRRKPMAPWAASSVSASCKPGWSFVRHARERNETNPGVVMRGVPAPS